MTRVALQWKVNINNLNISNKLCKRNSGIVLAVYNCIDNEKIYNVLQFENLINNDDDDDDDDDDDSNNNINDADNSNKILIIIIMISKAMIKYNDDDRLFN